MGDKTKIDFGKVRFQLMANGEILVTLEWNGEMATLSRSQIIRTDSRSFRFDRLREMLSRGNALTFPPGGGAS